MWGITMKKSKIVGIVVICMCVIICIFIIKGNNGSKTKL